jgi:DNA-dependent protein kinase catalytic subunit
MAIRDIYYSVNSRLEDLDGGKERLVKYSEWLAYSYNYFDVLNYIEIPGQYEDDHREPYVDNHVKIAGFKPEILVLDSIRKPKKLSINGSNEKEYNLLVKGGEDLRLDQRVQQVFKIMND